MQPSKTLAHISLGTMKEKISHSNEEEFSGRAIEFALIQYLLTLVKNRTSIESFDFAFVRYLLENGANINNCDVIGQSPFHIVAKYWDIDVARFLLDHGAEINAQDSFGRCPLHEACALSYVDMAEFLLQNGAAINIQTFDQKQSPIHFAAKNDSCECLKLLLAYGADINSLDGKNRTPLQFAAEMSRGNVALYLIKEGASVAIYDSEGNSALTLLIEKMPDVAVKALDQLYSIDGVTRREFYFLYSLEGAKLNEQRRGRITTARTPFEVAVQKSCFDIVMHPVFQRLIELKWEHFGKSAAIFDLILNLLYTTLWLIASLGLCYKSNEMYFPLKSRWWLIAIEIFIIILTAYDIRKQFKDTILVHQQGRDCLTSRAQSVEKDLHYCQPDSTDEWKYLATEVNSVRNHSSRFNNFETWIYYEWLTLVLVVMTMISRVVFVICDSSTAYKIHRFIFIVLLLVLWIRIAKYARLFQAIGPIIVISSHIMKDIIKCSFLFAILFIPYACAFWLCFGIYSPIPVHGYDNFGDLMYSMIAMMVGVDFPFNDLHAADPIMAQLLCSSFVISTAIIVVNILIALLSHTFTRLYSNAVENAVMQRARGILQLERTMSRKRRQEFYQFMKESCNPQVVTLDHVASKSCYSRNDKMNDLSLAHIQGTDSNWMNEIQRQNLENSMKIDRILRILVEIEKEDSLEELSETEYVSDSPELDKSQISLASPGYQNNVDEVIQKNLAIDIHSERYLSPNCIQSCKSRSRVSLKQLNRSSRKRRDVSVRRTERKTGSFSSSGSVSI